MIKWLNSLSRQNFVILCIFSSMIAFTLGRYAAQLLK